MQGLHSRIGSVYLALVMFVALTAGCQPTDERPGLWLSGEVEAGPVQDWSFSDAVEEIFVETRTWYGVRHSVTIWGAAQGGHFYLPSLYYGEEEYPNARFWNRNVVRDPRVRVKIGDRLFEGTAELISDLDTTVLRYVSDAEQLAQVYNREMLCANDEIRGPAIVREPLSTTYITQNQLGRVGSFGEISIEKIG